MICQVLDDRPFDDMSWVQLGMRLGQLEEEIKEAKEEACKLREHIKCRLARVASRSGEAR